MTSLKQSILKASLPHIPAHGFTKDCIIRGCNTLGLSSSAAGIIDSGPLDLAIYFYQCCNDDLSKILKGNTEFEKLGVTSKIRAAVIHRVQLLDPVLNMYHQAHHLLVLNPSKSLPCLMSLMDDIWFLCGDKSLDFNWYSKRIILSGIYTSTELFYMNDHSSNKEKTKEFLNRRLHDSYQFSKRAADLSNLSRLYTSAVRFSGYQHVIKSGA